MIQEEIELLELIAELNMSENKTRQALGAEIKRLTTAVARAREQALVAALQGAQEAFDILANATAEDGWIYVAPQFVSANLAAVTAALAGARERAEEDAK